LIAGACIGGMTRSNRIAAIARTQRGAFTREQANAAALSNGQLRRRVRSSRLDRVGFRTYRDPHTPCNLRDELSDFVLDAGEAWISGPTAAAIHGLVGFTLRKPFHIVVRRGRNVQRVGAYVHTSRALPLIDRTVVDGLPVITATRTLVDIAAITSPDPLRAAIADAFAKGLSSETFLHERLTALRRSGRPGSRALLDALEEDEIVNGRPSWLERRFRELLQEQGLPLPETEVVLTRARDRLVRVDCYFRDRNVVVELLGYRWHRTKEQMRRDAERLNQLTLDGKTAFQFTYDQVVEDPDYVLGIVRRIV